MFPKPKPRAETPSDVMVTTESRTAATTSVRGGADAVAPLLPVAVVTAAPPGALVGAAPRPSGPVTSAAVPPAASTADRAAAAITVAVPRRPDDRRAGLAVVAGGVATKLVGVDGWTGIELDGVRGVSGGGVAPRSWSNIGSSDRAGSQRLVRWSHPTPAG